MSSAVPQTSSCGLCCSVRRLLLPQQRQRKSGAGTMSPGFPANVRAGVDDCGQAGWQTLSRGTRGIILIAICDGYSSALAW